MENANVVLENPKSSACVGWLRLLYIIVNEEVTDREKEHIKNCSSCKETLLTINENIRTIALG